MQQFNPRHKAQRMAIAQCLRPQRDITWLPELKAVESGKLEPVPVLMRTPLRLVYFRIQPNKIIESPDKTLS